MGWLPLVGKNFFCDSPAHNVERGSRGGLGLGAWMADASHWWVESVDSDGEDAEGATGRHNMEAHCQQVPQVQP